MRVALTALTCASWTGAALAQSPDAPPPLHTMSCDMMAAEMDQVAFLLEERMDPKLLAQMMAQQQATSLGGAVLGSLAQQALSAALCGSHTLASLACSVAQSAGNAVAREREAREEGRMLEMEAMADRAFDGIDLDRIDALQDRYAALGCPVADGRESDAADAPPAR